MAVKVKISRVNRDMLPIPIQATELSAGVDLVYAGDKDLTLDSLDRALLPTGIAISLPAGYEAQVRPRSGLAIKHGITLLNSPGTIDADYRGEIKVIFANMGKEPYTVHPGDRIAQLVVSKVESVEFIEVEELDDTERSSGGFGHSGR